MQQPDGQEPKETTHERLLGRFGRWRGLRRRLFGSAGAEDDGTRPAGFRWHADDRQLEGARRRICWRRLEGGIVLDDIGRAEFSGAGAALAHRAIAEFKRKAACAVQRRRAHVDGDGVVTFALQPVVCEGNMRWVDDVLEQRVPAVGEVARVCSRIRPAPLGPWTLDQVKAFISAVVGNVKWNGDLTGGRSEDGTLAYKVVIRLDVDNRIESADVSVGRVGFDLGTQLRN